MYPHRLLSFQVSIDNANVSMRKKKINHGFRYHRQLITFAIRLFIDLSSHTSVANMHTFEFEDSFLINLYVSIFPFFHFSTFQYIFCWKKNISSPVYLFMHPATQRKKIRFLILMSK